MKSVSKYVALAAIALSPIGMASLLFSDQYQQAGAREALGYLALTAMVKGLDGTPVYCAATATAPAPLAGATAGMP